MTKQIASTVQKDLLDLFAKNNISVAHIDPGEIIPKDLFGKPVQWWDGHIWSNTFGGGVEIFRNYSYHFSNYNKVVNIIIDTCAKELFDLFSKDYKYSIFYSKDVECFFDINQCEVCWILWVCRPIDNGTTDYVLDFSI